jgi:membrane-bound metal-dependent hydrolase YbcI (DUF457 family)
LLAVGHMAIAYLLGKGSAKPLKINLNIPLLLVVSILPDIDIIFDTLLIPNFHRTLTHSLLFAVVFFIPFFVVYRKTAIPYFIALLSHSLIGDFFIGGNVQLLWPLQTEFGLPQLGGPNLSVFSITNEIIELILFAAATFVLIKSRDLLKFFEKKKTNFFLLIPMATVLLPTLIGFPLATPLIIAYPPFALVHLFYLVLFSASVIFTFVLFIRERPTKKA